MIEKIQFLAHFFVTLAKLIRPGGVKTVLAKNLLLKRQLLMLTRQRSRVPRLTSFDRVLFGYMTFFISKERLQKIAVILKPATILKFHQALVKRKYRVSISIWTPPVLQANRVMVLRCNCFSISGFLLGSGTPPEP